MAAKLTSSRKSARWHAAVSAANARTTTEEHIRRSLVRTKTCARRRKVTIHGETAEIRLSRGETAVIDASDVPFVQCRCWDAIPDRGGNSEVVATGSARQRAVTLADYLMNPPPGHIVIHWDRDPMNCKRANLRVCTRSEQKAYLPMRADNKSGFKGVSKADKYGKFKVYIKCKAKTGGKSKYVGYFTDRIDAARAYDRKAIELFGEYATVNFPEEHQPAPSAEPAKELA